MIRVVVAGASGYSGGELLRILAGHPEVEIGRLAAGEQAGKRLAGVHPRFRGTELGERVLAESDWNALGEGADVAFLALPHGHAITAAPRLLAQGCRVIDIGADFRLRDPQQYTRWYGLEHSAVDLLHEAVYGLPEVFRPRIAEARLVANPGCYPTAAALALLPLLPHAADEAIVVDAKSGVSGAGRKASLEYAFSEIDESLRPYGVLSHRHTPEIAQTLAFAGAPRQVVFTPHLIPMIRGLLATCYVRLEEEPEDLQALYSERYRGEPFVTVLGPDELPVTGSLRGVNRCEVAVRYDAENRLAVAFGALDNLVKGAAGQAVQNMNLMFGVDERTGLEAAPTGS
ncbi:MAG TPA: N-acetyl-gamma-glutamyl-phosphate reductase [Thermoanaerobaculia bacterium]|nr:N-acetyl-gamma-glutamyl-phosphate reductase [Thermoanaerobaculia bacterium]